jgi:NitT/TauT family transport system ATP-binding protein
MSSRPGRILETREVGFARPRTLESSYAPEFATLVQQLRMRIADARDGDATPPAAATAASLEEVAA